MNSVLRIKLFFLALFAVGCVAIWSYQIFYVWPKDRCEGHGGWWDGKRRLCAQPILLPKLTGRPFGSPPMISPMASGDTERDLTAPSAYAREQTAKRAAQRVEPGVQSTSPAP